jgi:hypothetical protein
LFSLFAVCFILSFSVVLSAHTEADPLIVDLIAGGGGGDGFLAGHVHVWNDAEYLYVKYLVNNSDFCITQTHLHVATSWTDIPQKNGNPIPGQFEYSGMHECPALDYTYQIPLTWSPGQTLHIAAHAVVQTMTGYSLDLIGFTQTLPDQVSIWVTRESGFGFPSYFDVTVGGGSILDGMYDSFCVDTDHGIIQKQWLTANVFSSLEPLPPGLIEFPENLDLVNYIINQSYLGMPSPSGGVYTWCDIANAIWQLLEDNPEGDCGGWSQDRVNEILADAFANGEGFVPGCMEWIALILEPLGDWELQILFIQVQIPCVPSYETDTAWAAGFDFPGRNWAMYFAYTIQ